VCDDLSSASLVAVNELGMLVGLDRAPVVEPGQVPTAERRGDRLAKTLFKLRIVHLSRPPRRFGDQQHRDPVTHGCQINGGAAWYVLESSTHEVEWRSGIQSAALAVVILSAHAAAHGGPAR
jgi:hypothetical protein